ncbi:WD40 repeat-like protein [Gonapodya prolifera JEL478]|uniref:WD40 repeat-like protein n=1 Tax=Gonapodya prolifera (strain JEL478) TaxID=1344416 RepID=A0A139A8Z5_GONPJ|nr:WD40 repeat-like protein [Gonapodya prolifera JEL478]|eukprot:KXS12935.1 WD40 repeat-like protein [Gonapodya prolifera JEL478]
MQSIREPTALTPEIVSQFALGKVFKDNEKHITSICFDDTGEFCVTASEDESIRLYSCKTGTLEKTSFSRKYGCSLARFTHRANNIIHASTKEDNAIRYLSFHDNRYLKYFQGHKTRVVSMDMAPADDHFISASEDDSIRLWDLRSGQCQGMINISGYGHPSVSYDPSGKVLGVALSSSKRGNSVRLYDVANLGTGPFTTYETPDPYAPPPLHPMITSLKFSNDGKMLLLGTNQSFLYLHDAFSLDLTRRLEGLENGATIPLEGDFTPDAKFVVCGSQTGPIHFWSAETGERFKEFEGHQEPTRVVAFNPRYMMFASADTNLGFWIPRSA